MAKKLFGCLSLALFLPFCPVTFAEEVQPTPTANPQPKGPAPVTAAQLQAQQAAVTSTLRAMQAQAIALNSPAPPIPPIQIVTNEQGQEVSYTVTNPRTGQKEYERQTEYRRMPDGKLQRTISESSYNRLTGQIIQSIRSVYDGNERVAQTIRSYRSNGQLEGLQEKALVTHPNGFQQFLITLAERYGPNGTLQARTRFDVQNRIASHEEYHSNGNLGRRITYNVIVTGGFYNEQRVTWEEFYANGRPSRIVTRFGRIEYWADGRVRYRSKRI